ncbi:hypothetical protein Phi4:1_gp122 [Cellulophaga phage phi4:1]|jgi:hypothetical protein|uniref:Uncharacterized protein n=5 Tax=Lightbulbvirus TaxID=1918522 RepID=A0A0S2MWM7_9CAUD|nr:hypothetical protein Phi4:1_gp122 [Cellulophaga phage phi4:1]YP_008241621.1 hypothetical protein Phi17:2_gp126 [Cellulophaga phage phi17:2]ALO80131.1 hypothetical protein Phi4113_122 [Cellulophaga phage phi4:1_13]ALO80328.1 hypothetical protein Phi4118_122 [Cellulophaga phage phi4:1_18]ALO80529.1 hypothetical protein Phi17218_126 [Cellulophaga phage phi17:2_18]AGO47659.1 hypothetical protein Phi17:2_gp126 [Cellulophaga phage phi17:2]AGO49535.1 hypothetical protein Phi4:1_gp122 [Cellulophag
MRKQLREYLKHVYTYKEAYIILSLAFLALIYTAALINLAIEKI